LSTYVNALCGHTEEYPDFNINTIYSIAPGVEDSVEPFYDHHIMQGDRSQKMASKIAMQMQRRGNSARYRYALNI
jgi:hypothetical protein